MASEFARRLRAPLETVAAYTGLALIPWLPRRAVLSISRFLGYIGYCIARKPRRIARANLDTAFGSSLSDSRKREILIQSFRTFALVLMDLFWFSRKTRERVRKYVELDETVESIRPYKPAICVTGHFGNWEILGHAVAYFDPPFLAVAARIKNPSVDRLLGRLRRDSAQNIAHRKGAARQAVHALKEGARIGLLLDQNVTPRDGGVFVNFFGLPVPMSSVAERLALKTGAPILFSFCVPRGEGYQFHAPPPILKESFDTSEGGLTQAIAKILEDTIRNDPGSWLWMYKRWKLIPPGAPAERYPFYSRPLVPVTGKQAG